MTHIIGIAIATLSFVFIAQFVIGFIPGFGPSECEIKTRWKYVFPAHNLGCKFWDYMGEVPK